MLFKLPLLAALVFLGSSISVFAEKPNVLFIISDDLSKMALGCYGNKQCKTPNIDKLASQGMRFDRAYCQFPVCGPSRAAMMAGRYPQAVGVTGNGSSEKFTEVMGDRPSMSQHFKNNGYYSGRVSKIYHMLIPGNITEGVHGPDHEASWTERFSMHAPEWMSSGEHEHISGEKLRFDKDVHYRLGFGGAFYVVKTDTDGSEQPDVMATDKAIELLNANKDKPFFLAVGLVRPHVPLVAPKSYFDLYPVEEMELPEKVPNDQADIPRAGLTGTSKARKIEDPIKQKKCLSAYYASVTFMDDQVGRLVDELDKLNLRENTIVVFKSDHGWHLGEHDLWQKMSLHEESASIPLIVSVPGKKPGVSESLVEQIDLYPTLAELAGLELPDHLQGKSLVPVLDDPMAKVRDAAYTLRSKSHLLRTNEWAYMDYSAAKGGGEELYDMVNDPKQFTNLADDPAHAETKKKLKRQLEKKLAEIDA
ncbi:MAG: sulfatase [Verrucomicrobiota bacterium]